MHNRAHHAELMEALKCDNIDEDEYRGAHLKLLYSIHQENLRQSRQLYNHAHPVDEYISGLNPPSSTGTTNELEIQRDYEIPVRIECIHAAVPVGVTEAHLKLGQRIIPLYSGTATAVITQVLISPVGYILNPSDKRLFSWTGTPTSGFHVSLTGYAIERYGNS